MSTHDYTISFAVPLKAQEVFQHINNVTSWWTEFLEGSSKELNDVFTVRFFVDVHVSTQKLIEVIPNKKVVWLVTASRLNFIKEMDEWTNTTIHFDITQEGEETRIDFTHMGLTPDIECYNSCTKGWDYYIKGSLYKLLMEGKGTPEVLNPSNNR